MRLVDTQSDAQEIHDSTQHLHALLRQATSLVEEFDMYRLQSHYGEASQKHDDGHRFLTGKLACNIFPVPTRASCCGHQPEDFGS